ncbi:hypothetical protein C7M84_009929 [Penaeus vannamei]|uniref:Reverse transcriptase domain-containing protein n=1 Tax=Penaeus vannamei TaxID=6689 RepID=A0A423T5P0_PENVA|nr:hypothetical protein C7M84_009929 [Penaeus vannamei]
MCWRQSPSSYSLVFAAWLDNQDQNQDVEYENLKSYLLQEFTLSVSARAQKLLSLPHIPLGDTTAHAAWNEMQALATLPDLDPTTNKPRRVDLMQELWLQRLPPSVRSALHEADDSPINDLIKKADNLINAARASRKPDTTYSASAEDVPDINAANKRRPNSQVRHYKPGSASSQPSHGFCYYHYRFGAGAHKCLPGCQWPKKRVMGPPLPAKVATQNPRRGNVNALDNSASGFDSYLQIPRGYRRIPFSVQPHSRKQNSFLDTTIKCQWKPHPNYTEICTVRAIPLTTASAKSTQTFFDQNSVSSLDSQPNMEYSITSKRQALRYTQNSGFYLQRSFKQLNKLTPKWNGWASVKRHQVPGHLLCILCGNPKAPGRPWATFQRMMDGILGDLPFCACYVDDILIFSGDPNEHLQHLRVVLKRLHNNGLVVRQDKCQFGATSVEFLGHKISPTGVSPLPTTTLTFPTPGIPLTLTTDASSIAVGAVVEQTIRGKTHPLGFFSRKLRQAEITSHWYMLFPNLVMLGRTDNSGNSPASPSLAALSNIHQGMNPVADALSRVEINSINLGIDYNEVAAAQKDDPETTEYHTAITSLQWKDVHIGGEGTICVM